MGTIHSRTVQELRSLEERLLDPQVRASPGAVAALLAEEFLEFGRSGRVYDRSGVIETIAATPPSAREVLDFRVRLLGRNHALVTFRTVGPAGTAPALRCSVWSRTQDGWRLLFHQGTPAASTSVQE